MRGKTRNRWSLVVALMTVLAAPLSAGAHDGSWSSGSVTFGFGDHYGGDRHYYYPDRYRGGYGPPGRAHGYYARPRCPTPYYRPYTRIYYEPRYVAPRYYDYGGSGWDIDLRYHFSDR